MSGDPWDAIRCIEQFSRSGYNGTTDKIGRRADMSVGVMVELKVEEIASGIKKLNKKDREALLLLLSGEGKEIKKRLKEIETGKVKTLTRKELLNDVL
jgi:hypothetical protein